MSKSTAKPWEFSDPAPSYEESIATQPRPVLTPREKSTSGPSLIRQERSRRIGHLVINFIIPCFTLHLANACNKLTIAIVPSEVLRTSSPVTERNIVAPTVPKEITATVIPLSGDENRSSFWTQHAVVQELDQALRRELCGSAVPDDFSFETSGFNPSPVPSRLQYTPDLPARPAKKSWLKRTFVLPDPDHDPTGETGKWNLGWREADPSIDQGGSWNDGRAATHAVRTRTLGADEVEVHTNLRDISFRTESELGLLETTTVKCIWVEIEIGI